MKQLLEVVLRTSVVAGAQAREESERPNRDARLYVRLDPDDRLMLADRANARGMAPATYAAMLMRAHLRHLTPLPKDELLALKRAIAELGAIGMTRAGALLSMIRPATQTLLTTSGA